MQPKPLSSRFRGNDRGRELSSACQIFPRVDVARDARVVDVEQLQLGFVRPHERLGPLVARQRRELAVVAPRKTNRVTAHAPVRRGDESGTFVERVHDERDGLAAYPRHVRERHQPPFGNGGRTDSPGEAMTHALRGVWAESNPRAVIHKRAGKRHVAGANYGQHGIDATAEIDQCAHAEGRAVLQSSEELTAAKTPSAAGGEEDADDRTAGCRPGHSGSNRNLPSLTVTSTLARSSMPLWFVGLMLNTPWQPVTFRCSSSASRNATRNASVPGLAALTASGMACCNSNPAS